MTLLAGPNHPASPGPLEEIRLLRKQVNELKVQVEEWRQTAQRTHETNRQLQQERDDALAREQTAIDKLAVAMRGKKHA